MRITFADVRHEPNKTFVFVSNLIIRDLKFCLDREHIEYEIYGKKDFEHVLPADISIPEIKAMPVLGSTRICKNPAVIISHLNADQFHAKLEQIALRNDDELQARIRAMDAQALQSYEKNYKHLDGQIPVSKI